MLKRHCVNSIVAQERGNFGMHLLLRFKFLVRRFYHLVLLRQVYPKLKAARFGLARFVDGHFSMDD
jgi:hypothetical protein